MQPSLTGDPIFPPRPKQARPKQEGDDESSLLASKGIKNSTLEQVKLKPEDKERLDQQAEAFVKAFAEDDVDSEEFQSRISHVIGIGDDNLRTSSELSNRMLERPMKALKNASDPDSTIAKGLFELRNKVAELDPSAKRGFFQSIVAIIPFRNKAREYLARSTSARVQLNDICDSLYRGRDELIKDNVQIDADRKTMWATMIKMRGNIYLCEVLETKMEALRAKYISSDPRLARIIQDEVIFPTRQKSLDLQTQMAINMTAYLTLDNLYRTNKELIDGVRRATTTTVSALQNAIVAAQAIATQDAVVGQIGIMNRTTESLMRRNTQNMRTQTSEILRQASTAVIDPNVIHECIEDLRATIDSVEQFRAKALVDMDNSLNSIKRDTARLENKLVAPKAEGQSLSVETLQVLSGGEESS